MSTVEITASNFESTIQDHSIVILDFWASWCAPCRRFAPIFEDASARNADIVFGKVDTEAQQELAGQMGIRSIPTVMVFRDQILLFAQPGALPAGALDELIEKVRALDMDAVRRKIAEQEQ